MENEFRGTKTLQTFSPRWTNDELLEKTLTGRRGLVDRLEELARDGAGGPNKHQRLIIGVRGSGKTHVLKVLHNRLWRDERLKERLLIVYLLEDELGVASFLDFLVRMLRAIVHWYPDHSALAGELNELYDLPAAAQQRRAVDLLLSAAKTKDVLILMENLGLIFDKTRGFGKKGQQALRDLVQQHPRFMIFATAQALIPGISDPEYPFFGFFKITHLVRLTLEEALSFLSSIASADGRQNLVDFLKTPEGQGRVKAIYQFTGGNHRLLVTFYDLLSGDSVTKLSELFLRELNPLRPFYQEQMRSLSAQQQKILQYLAVSRVPQPVKEISRGCLATQNTVSSQLKDLLDKNFVNRIEQGRESYYEITESLFRICYEADLEQEGAPVRLFVDFLANFYTAQELGRRYRGFRVLADTRGEIRRRAGQFEAALADYQAAIELDPKKVDAYFNMATAMIALGRTTETPAILTRALETYQGKPDADRGQLVVCFEENLTTLFRLAAGVTFRGFLSNAADLAHRAGVLAEFEKALGTALFALLREHATTEESRFRSVESALRESLEGRIDIRVILRLLDTGIRFFKQNDRKALLNLPTEERALLVSELGIAEPPV